MSAAAHASRFEAHCNDCHQAREVQTRLEHGARLLCDDCANRRSQIAVVAPSPPITTSVSGSSKREPSSSSLSLSHQEDGEPLVEWLLSEHKAGRRKPVAVLLPPLPDTARGSTRIVLELFQLVYGLRLSEEDERPVPLSARFVERHTALHYQAANFALNRLCDRYKVLTRGEPLPPRGARGTHTYLPGGVK